MHYLYYSRCDRAAIINTTLYYISHSLVCLMTICFLSLQYMNEQPNKKIKKKTKNRMEYNKKKPPQTDTKHCNLYSIREIFHYQTKKQMAE